MPGKRWRLIACGGATASLLVIGLVACGKPTPSPEIKSDPSPSTMTVKQLVDEAAFARAAGGDTRWLEELQRRADAGNAEAQTALGYHYCDPLFLFPDSCSKAVPWFEKAAMQGSADAQVALGRMYAAGQGVPENQTKAQDLLEKAARALLERANEGDAEAQFKLGVMNESGEAMPKDFQEANHWYEESAAQGYSDALMRLCWGPVEEVGATLDPKVRMRWCERAADKGEIWAFSTLGDIYAEGKIVPKDPEKATVWYERHAARGTADEQRRVAQMFAMGDKLSKDSVRANKWYSSAAKLYEQDAATGSAQAQYWLGVMYANGEGVSKNMVTAANLVEKAASQGYAPAYYDAGRANYFGDGVSKNPAKGIEWFTKAAKDGDVRAQSFLGWTYMFGDEVPTNFSLAVEWLGKAAAQGDGTAQYNLGYAYETGNGVPQDPAKAVELYQKAAQQDVLKALLALGNCYKSGTGVPKNNHKAFEYFERAATLGDDEAQLMLGAMYALGKGTQKNAAKSAEWTEKSAGQENAMAQSSLGAKYFVGDGVPKDLARALGWWTKAAMQGEPHAQYGLCWSYSEGKGAPKDYVLAYAWCNLAAAKDHAQAIQMRDTLTGMMLPAQRAEAERLSSQWVSGQTLGRENSLAAEKPFVSAETKPPSKAGSGTAFYVASEGYAVTNFHIIADCKEVKTQGQSGAVGVVARDTVSDLALLKISGEVAEVVVLAPEPMRLRQGQEIVVFGFPLDSVLSSGGNLTPGVVSALTGLGNNSNQIQITAPIQPGSSGSPVLDMTGRLVGVVSMKLSDAVMARETGSLPQNVNFAISGQTVRAFLDAQRVPYETGRSFLAFSKSLADIGDEARKWTTVVDCWK